MSESRSFTDLHVAVTGGTGALGRAVVGSLVEAGATVHVPVYHHSELADFPHADHGRVHLTGGVSLVEEAAAESWYGSLPPLWASIQVAGGFAMGPVAETPLADLRRMLDLNVVTCFLSCREAVKRIRASSNGGRLVNVAARPALVPTGGMVAYATSKAAVAAMSLALAEELASEGIWVNAIAPSVMNTPANRRAMPDADHDAWPTVEDVAATLVFLASPDNRCSRGSVVPVYGRA